MNREHFARLDRLFQAAIELPPGERPAWLARECGNDHVLLAEVQALLDADSDGAGTFVEEQVRHAVTAMAVDDVAPVHRAGPYELLRQLGSGGMGTVWLARRADDEYRSTVAVKLVRPGMDTELVLHRFRRERQILAQLVHPNIGRLLDGGTTPDGTPFIVMEFIDGVPITEHCRRAALDVRDRVRLFLQVCSAVSYAHQCLVLHRDLKPGNILVDAAGAPKLLDFGLGKLLYSEAAGDEITLTQGVGFLTPDYASPEQILGETVGVASDVYSLGAVLYELLAGAGPHAFDRFTPQAIEDAICRHDPVRPSARVTDRRTARELTGDLDTIVLKALQKEPLRRYASVSDLSEDLRRYLEFLPVRARADTAWYSARKFARRNRAWVSAAALVALSLLGGTLVAARQARVATDKASQVRELARAVIFDVHDAVRDVPGATKARQAVVTTALRYLDDLARDAAGDSAITRELVAGYIRVGDVQGNSARGPNLGDTGGALASYRKAAGLLELRLLRAPDDREARIEHATVLQRIGNIQGSGGAAHEALATYARAAGSARAALAARPDSRDTRALLGDILMESGRLRRLAGDMNGALAEVEEALRTFETLRREDPGSQDVVMSLASTESAVGLVLVRLERLQDAASHYDRAVEYYESLVRKEPTSVRFRRNLMIAYSHVGDVAGFPTTPNLNDPPRAEAAYARMVAIARELRMADPDDARALVDYGIALMRLGVSIPDARVEDKLAALRDARAALEEGVRRRPGELDVRVNHGFTSVVTADLLRAAGRHAEALEVNRQAANILEPGLGATHPTLLSHYILSQGPLAEEMARRGNRTGAAALAQRLVDLAERAAAAQQDLRVVGPRVALPRAYTAAMRVSAALGDRSESARWRLKALDAWRSLEGKAGFVDSFRRDMRALEGAP